jgi:hypothetical protein
VTLREIESKLGSSDLTRKVLSKLTASRLIYRRKAFVEGHPHVTYVYCPVDNGIQRDLAAS